MKKSLYFLIEWGERGNILRIMGKGEDIAHLQVSKIGPLGFGFSHPFIRNYKVWA